MTAYTAFFRYKWHLAAYVLYLNSSMVKQHRVRPCNWSIAITALTVLQAIMVERKEDKPAGAAAGGGGMPGGFGPGGMPAGLTM